MYIFSSFSDKNAQKERAFWFTTITYTSRCVICVYPFLLTCQLRPVGDCPRLLPLEVPLVPLAAPVVAPPAGGQSGGKSPLVFPGEGRPGALPAAPAAAAAAGGTAAVVVA